MDTASVTRAAQSLGITAGAVSQRIASGPPRRSSRMIRPATRARSISDGCNGADLPTRQAASPAAAAVPEYGDPGDGGSTEDIVAGLLARRFDLGLISMPVSDDKLDILPLFEEELIGLRPAHKRAAGTRVVQLGPAEPAQTPFLLYPKRSNMRQSIDGFFHQLSIDPRVRGGRYGGDQAAGGIGLRVLDAAGVFGARAEPFPGAVSRRGAPAGAAAGARDGTQTIAKVIYAALVSE
jgi:hypothetical protein